MKGFNKAKYEEILKTTDCSEKGTDEEYEKFIEEEFEKFSDSRKAANSEVLKDEQS